MLRAHTVISSCVLDSSEVTQKQSPAPHHLKQQSDFENHYWYMKQKGIPTELLHFITKKRWFGTRPG